MMHSHDTDRILGVLGEAIEKLRDHNLGTHFLVHRNLRDEIANDLALLHGAVSAERDQSDEVAQNVDALLDLTRAALQGRGSVATHEDTQRRAFLTLVKREEIEDEVMRGEHRDD